MTTGYVVGIIEADKSKSLLSAQNFNGADVLEADVLVPTRGGVRSEAKLLQEPTSMSASLHPMLSLSLFEITAQDSRYHHSQSFRRHLWYSQAPRRSSRQTSQRVLK